MPSLNKNSPDFELQKSFPEMNDSDKSKITAKFASHYIPMGLEKYETFEKQREELFSEFEAETNRHKQVSESLNDRMNLDPQIALKELEAINKFMEKIMTEQAYLYSNGLRAKERKIEEACAGIE